MLFLILIVKYIFRFRPKMAGLFRFRLFFGRKREFIFRLLLFYGRKSKIHFRSASNQKTWQFVCRSSQANSFSGPCVSSQQSVETQTGGRRGDRLVWMAILRIVAISPAWCLIIIIAVYIQVSQQS